MRGKGSDAADRDTKHLEEIPVEKLGLSLLVTFAFPIPRKCGRAGANLVPRKTHANLDFRIIQKLATLRRIDMLIHVSALDLQRNLPQQLTDEEAGQFDAFAPGWRHAVDTTGTTANIRRLILEYWEGLVKELGMQPFSNQRTIKSTGGQRLYWPMLASKELLAQQLWKRIGRVDRQGEFDL